MSKQERKMRFQELLEEASKETGYKIVATFISKSFSEEGLALEPVLVIREIEMWDKEDDVNKQELSK